MMRFARPLVAGAALLVLILGMVSQAAHAQGVGDELRTLEASIQKLLSVHGSRVMGRGVYTWTTQMDQLDQCRAVFSEQETVALGDRIVKRHAVNITLSRVTWVSIDAGGKWIEIPCLSSEDCVTTFTRCTKTTKDGITVDCTSPSGKRGQSFHLQWDGDEAAGKQLEHDLRQAVELCHAPAR